MALAAMAVGAWVAAATAAAAREPAMAAARVRRRAPALYQDQRQQQLHGHPSDPGRTTARSSCVGSYMKTGPKIGIHIRSV
jgi:hypothetical protein